MVSGVGIYISFRTSASKRTPLPVDLRGSEWEMYERVVRIHDRNTD